MKFSHGAWQWLPGVTPTCVRRVTEHRVERDALVIFALDRHGREGVDRFEGLILQLRISSPMADVIRVQIQHYAPLNRGPSGFELDHRLVASHVKIEEQVDHLLFTSGRVTVKIRRSDWSLEFFDGEKLITGGAADSLGYMTTAAGTHHLMQRLSLDVGETIYGLGERFGPLAKNGQSVIVWNEDGGTISDLAYKNIPFYLSSRGYGLLVNSPGKVEFEIATERVMQVQFSVPHEALDYYLFFGPEPKDVLEKYTRLSGRPALPPAWSFGLWLSTSFTTQYNEATVMEFVDGMAERDLPLSVFHFDCFWMKERHWCDFEWDRDAFPDPKGMLQRLKAKGLRICVWINPYISALSPLFAEGRENGYFLKTKAGDPYQRDQWQPAMALVDFTNPAAVTWYQAKLRALLEMGVDAFKTDFAERIPTDVVYHDGSDPELMHNYYAYVYNKVVFELLETFHGKDEALVFARSASGGSQKFPVHWGGDCEATFSSMAEDLRGGLSFCMSGPAFWSHDIGGFTGKADAAIFKRWLAFGLLSSHSRLHGSESYRVPWLYDEEAVTVTRHFTNLKNSLIPYLFAAAHDAKVHGWPIMRAMILEYSNDPACQYLERQYMLGGSLLVSPIFRHDHVAQYYLPKGRWTNLLSGRVVEGGTWRSETHDFLSLPLFVKQNTLLPVGTNVAEPRWTFDDELTLHVFQLRDGADITAGAACTAGGGVETFQCVRKGSQIILRSSGKCRRVRVMLRGLNQTGLVRNGRLLDETTQGLLIEWSDSASPLIIEGAGRGTPPQETLPADLHENGQIELENRPAEAADE